MLYPGIHKQMRIALAVAICSMVFAGCGKMYPSEWGERLRYKGSDLFYTPAVTEAEARGLGDYLSETGFFQEGNPGTAQITKEGDIYIFRMVVKESKEEDTEFLRMAGIFAAQISRDVFEGKQVGIHLCDKGFKTMQSVTYKIEDTQEKIEDTQGKQ